MWMYAYTWNMGMYAYTWMNTYMQGTRAKSQAQRHKDTHIHTDMYTKHSQTGMQHEHTHTHTLSLSLSLEVDFAHTHTHTHTRIHTRT
jgi:hypothetical protein